MRLQKLVMRWSGLALLVLMASPQASHAEAFLGATTGVSDLKGDLGGGLAYGAQGAYFVSETFGVGAFMQMGKHANDVSSTFLGGQGIFRFSTGGASTWNLAATVGTGHFSQEALSGNNALSYGAKMGYDYRFGTGNPITLGAEVGVLFLEPASTVFSPVSSTLAAKWWF